MANGGWDFTADSEIQGELANNLESLADQFDVRINDLYSKISELGSNKYWVGEDYDQFYVGAEGYKNAIGDLSDSIRMFSTQLKKIQKGTDELADECIEILKTMTTRNARSYYEVLEEEFVANENAERYISTYEHKDEDYLSANVNNAYMQEINDYNNYSELYNNGSYTDNGKINVPSINAAVDAWLHDDEIKTASILKNSVFYNINNLQNEIAQLEANKKTLQETTILTDATKKNIAKMDEQIKARQDYNEFLTNFYTTKLAAINPESSESEAQLKSDILTEMNNGKLTEEHEKIVDNIANNYANLINELYSGNGLLDKVENVDALNKAVEGINAARGLGI